MTRWPIKIRRTIIVLVLIILAGFAVNWTSPRGSTTEHVAFFAIPVTIILLLIAIVIDFRVSKSRRRQK